jgi:hypothetical protein
MSQASLMGPTSSSDEGSLKHRIIDDPQQGWEKWWLWANERINPIVVKEVRQSLKSKQFTISFGLTLVAAVSWTLIAISLMVPRIFYMPAGIPLLSGYFCILAAPLMVIIPFGAFLSLTAETEDSTFELLSISALSALQIVHGKMASACVQILLYLSALAPCIVLTYLMRGVGLYTILFFLGWTVMLSICETALALLLGAIARTRMLQVGAAVLALAGLFAAVGTWLSFLLSVGLNTLNSPASSDFVLIVALLMILAASISLVLRAAAAAIDFPSENHSTPLRKRIFMWVVLVSFWSLLGILVVQELEAAIVLLIGLFIFLMVIGALVTGERGVVSPRAQRGLPQTFVGRALLTWFYPGAGLGYVFVVCLYAALVVTLSAVDLFYQGNAQTLRGDVGTIAAGYLLLCYLAIYVGINRLLMMLVPRHVPARMLASTALMITMLVLSHMLPLFIAYYANDYRDFPYAWHQAFNIVWSLEEITDNNSFDIGASMAIVTLCAIAVFGLNLAFCTRDVMLVRVVAPPRILQEENLKQPTSAVPADPFAD